MKTEAEIRDRISEYDFYAQEFALMSTTSTTENGSTYWIRLSTEEQDKALALRWVLGELDD